MQTLQLIYHWKCSNIYWAGEGGKFGLIGYCVIMERKCGLISYNTNKWGNFCPNGYNTIVGGNSYLIGYSGIVRGNLELQRIAGGNFRPFVGGNLCPTGVWLATVSLYEVTLVWLVTLPL